MTPKPTLQPASTVRPAPQGGYVLLILPVVLVGILLLGTQMARRAQTSLRIAGAEMDFVQTRFCNETMTAVESNRGVRSLESGRSILTGTRAASCGSGRGAIQCLIDVKATAHELKKGCYEISRFESLMPIRSQCRNGDGQSSLLDIKVRLEEIPVYQFAAFYDGYMLIGPGPDMAFKGRVHSNDTIAFYPHKLVTFSNWITSPKAITGALRDQGRLAFAHMDGSGADLGAIVNLTGSTFTSLKNQVSGWTTFKGNHRIAFGKETNGCGPVETLTLKNLKAQDPHTMIEWRHYADGAEEKELKYAWRANLIYKDGGWRNNSLAPVVPPLNPIVLPATPAGWTSTSPQRVNVNVRAEGLITRLLPINVGRLLARSPNDSIIYLFDEFRDPSQGNRMAGGFLLHNAAALTRPLTIVSNSRIVVLGNYNTAATYIRPEGGTGFFPSALVCDHFISLSPYYLPGEHDQAGEGKGSLVVARNPSASFTVNSCLTVGGTRLSDGHWQGVYMLPQHMEDLVDVTVTFSGSMTCLFTSKWVTQIGLTGDYGAPIRNFAFDPMYNDMRNMPPGTPRMVSPALSEWHMVRD